MSTCAIETTGLYKRFGKQTVLDGIDLTVPAGTIFALLGPNGAGKTTLVNILSTLIRPDDGKALVVGYDVVKQKETVKQSISLTGQFAAVDDMLTAEENLRMIGRLSGLTAAQARKRAAELLSRFELTPYAGKRVKTFSGGMRRKLDLAISLTAERPVLFLDEPTTALDTISRRTLWETILQLKQTGTTIFLTTQYLEEAEQLADRIAVISGGRIVAAGTADELKARIGGAMLELRDAQDEVIRSVPTTGHYDDIRQILNRIAGEVPPLTRVGIRTPSMDDVFVALTSGKMNKNKEESAS